MPLGLFFPVQNTEGHVVQEICRNAVGGGQLLFSETPCPYHIFIIAGASPLMVNILALHDNAQLFPIALSPRWQHGKAITPSAAKLARSWRKVSDVREPNTL